MNVAARIAIEKRIIRAIVRDVIAAGYAVTVHDGEAIVMSSSRDERAIMGAVMSVDEEHLLVYRDGLDKPIGWVRLVYGNDGWDVVNDYTTNLESLLSGSQRLADQLEQRYG